MAYDEWNRQIPLDEQLREVSRILVVALAHIHRYGAPPRPPVSPATRSAPGPQADVPRPKRKPFHRTFQPPTRKAKLRYLFKKRKRIRQKGIFWLGKVVAFENVPRDQLARAVSRIHRPPLELEFREALEHALCSLSPDERRVAGLVADRGLTHAARELNTSWRKVYNALVHMRVVFEKAGFEKHDGSARNAP